MDRKLRRPGCCAVLDEALHCTAPDLHFLSSQEVQFVHLIHGRGRAGRQLANKTFGLEGRKKGEKNKCEEETAKESIKAGGRREEREGREGV